MSAIGSFGSNSMMLEQLRDMQAQARTSNQSANRSMSDSKDTSFSDLLKEEMSKVIEQQKTADGLATDLATGKGQNLHETMLAATKAELSFNLMVQMRNKVLEAYQEIMRMQV